MMTIKINDYASDYRSRLRPGEPVEPLPARPDRTYDLDDIGGEFARFAPRFRIREPARSLDDLILTRRMNGSCLDPMFDMESTSYGFDPRVPADDGDLVLIAFSENYMRAGLDHLAGQTPEFIEWWREMYAPDGTTTNVGVKVLRHGGGRRWITCNQNCAPLEQAGQILAVATHIEVDGRPAYGSRSRASRYVRAWAREMIFFWR